MAKPLLPYSFEQMVENAVREDAADHMREYEAYSYDPRDADEMYVGLGDFDGGGDC